MPTSIVPIGGDLDILCKAEQTYGVTPVATTPFKRTPVYGFALSSNKPLEDDPLLGLAFNNDRDAQAPAPGLLEHSGSIDIPMDLAYIGDWLSLFCGPPTTTGTSPAITHVFNSGTATLPSWCIEQRIGASVEYIVHRGVVGVSLAMNIGPQAAGYRRFTANVAGRESSYVGASVAGTVPAGLRVPRVPIANTAGKMSINAVTVAELLSMTATYETGMEPERYADGNEGLNTMIPGESSSRFTGEMVIRWMDDSYAAMGVAGTSNTAVLQWRISGTLLLDIDLASLVVQRADPAIRGPGRIEQRLAFRCAQTLAAPMAKFTLKNDVAAAQYTSLHTYTA